MALAVDVPFISDVALIGNGEDAGRSDEGFIQGDA